MVAFDNKGFENEWVTPKKTKTWSLDMPRASSHPPCSLLISMARWGWWDFLTCHQPAALLRAPGVEKRNNQCENRDSAIEMSSLDELRVTGGFRCCFFTALNEQQYRRREEEYLQTCLHKWRGFRHWFRKAAKHSPTYTQHKYFRLCCCHCF